MDYNRLVDLYETLENEPGRLKKVEAIARLLKDTPREELRDVALLVQGLVFPSWSDKELGIANQLMVKALAQVTGYSEDDILSRFKKEGDFGLVIEQLTGKKKQSTLLKRKLTVQKIVENLRAVAAIEGSGAIDRKLGLVAELFSFATPKEAKYIARTTLGTLRIGVAEGVLRDAIAQAFANGDADAVEGAWFLRPDYGEIAVIAQEEGVTGLHKVELEPGKPYTVLLSEKAPSLEEALTSYEHPALEWKYDGARVSIHKKGSKVWLFTRRLENVTRQFPEIVDAAKDAITLKDAIVEGEMIAFQNGRPAPFQMLSQRIKRKYDIERTAQEIPAQVHVFDVVYDGKTLFQTPLRERWTMLKKIVRPGKGFAFAHHLETTTLRDAEAFYKEALAAGQEGVMVKNLDALYQPGRRVAGGWLKVKPTMENLDLVIIGATWGTGKRTGWMGSFTLGVRDAQTGEFASCGMIGTGIKEKSEGVTFEDLTNLLKPHILADRGNNLVIAPIVVVEVAYEEIQRSPTYASGYALRFPRVVRIREDKGPEQADDVERMEALFAQQKGKR